MKIRTRLLLFILTSTLAVFAAIIYLNYSSSRKILVERIKTNAETKTDKYRMLLDSKLEDMTDIAILEGRTMESMYSSLDEASVKGLIKSFLSHYPQVYGSTIAFLPNSFKSSKLFAPYYHWDNDELVYVDLTGSSYDYQKWEWFTRPVETGKPFWTLPYVDVGGGNVPMVTYAVPFFKDDKVWGVTTIDLSLKDLTDVVKDIKVGKTGFAFLIDQKGTFLSLWRGEKNFGNTLFDAAKEFHSPELIKLADDMVAGKQGFVSLMNPMVGKRSWVAYAPLPTTGWSLGIVGPEDELLDDLVDLHHRIVVMACAGFILIFFIIFVISSHITRPIASLVSSVKRMAGGDLYTEIKLPSSKDEIGILAKNFNDMRNSIGSMMEQIREEKETFSIAFANMTDGIVVLDVNCNVLQYNRAAEKLLMLPAGEPMPMHLMKHFDGELPFGGDGGCVTRKVIFKLSRKQVGDLGPLHLEFLVSPIMDDNNRVKEHIMNVRNITEQEIEERSKRDFLSLMSHKLFTPLTVLQGKVMLLKDGLAGPLQEKQEKIVNSMVDQTGKLNDLVESLVNYVSLEEMKFDTSREVIKMNEYLPTVIAECSGWFADRSPEITFKVDDGSNEFSFNKKYLSLIIRQLIDNGLKFNMSSPPKVDINVSKTGDDTIFKVADNGTGIPPEFTDKIFEKFYQIEKYYTGNVEGVGLGLTYVKKLVEAFGGSIEVRSEIGKGSSFVIKLSNK